MKLDIGELKNLSVTHGEIVFGKKKSVRSIGVWLYRDRFGELKDYVNRSVE